MKTLAIFGATGSVGGTALKIYKDNKKKFKLLYLSSHTNFKKLNSLSKYYKPKNIILTNNDYCKKFINNTKKMIFKEKLFSNRIKKIDFVISGVSGYNALDFNINLLKISKKLLIANKETIVCGGNFFLKEAKRLKCEVIPIDSEHFCIDFFLKLSKKNKSLNLEKIYLMASGGPFLNKNSKYDEPLSNVVRHPTWKMGRKISVDSSNLSNKILELFEAKVLFNIPSNKLEILIEKKSNIHCLFKFKNQIHIPVMHKPNMQIPIMSGLNIQKNNIHLDLKKLDIVIQKPTLKKFPIINLGYKLLRMNSHSAMILFIVLNERLVNKYINKKIMYGDIVKYLVKAFKTKKIQKLTRYKVNNFSDVKKIINYGNELNIL